MVFVRLVFPMVKGVVTVNVIVQVLGAGGAAAPRSVPPVSVTWLSTGSYATIPLPQVVAGAGEATTVIPAGRGSDRLRLV